MKKDKDWLKVEIRLKKSMKPGLEDYISINNATKLANQLDEAEITEEQALNKLAESYPFSADGIKNILQTYIAGYSLPRK